MTSANTCRACLSSRANLDLYTVQDNRTIAEKIMSLTSVKIQTNDGLPHNICKKCSNDLDKALTFISKCRESNKKLKGQFICDIKQSTGYLLSDIESESDENSLDDSLLDELNQNEDGYTILLETDGEDDSDNIEQDHFSNNEVEYDYDPKICTDTKKSDESPVPKKTFPFRRLRVHRKQKCEVCGRTMSSKYALKLHMYKHNEDDKPYACTTCSKTFVLYSGLQNHLKIHTGERPYNCSNCNAAFTSQLQLTTHNYKHTGETPFECDVCSKRFNNKHNLKVHLMIHTGEKKFECDKCSYRSITQSGLRQHQKSHVLKQRYVCMLCGISAANIERHMLSHTGDRTETCKLCSANFYTKHHLKQHVKRVHDKRKASIGAS